MYRFGIDLPNVYELIKEAIRDSPLFQFDFFLQSRNVTELARRCTTLLGCVLKEINPEIQKQVNGGVKRSKESTPVASKKSKK